MLCRPGKAKPPPGFFVRAGASHCPVALRLPGLHVSSALCDHLLFIPLHKQKLLPFTSRWGYGRVVF
jgi:hypothetical protein